MNRTISIAREFTRYPGPRYAEDGPFSGQQFRDKILAPALREAIATNGTLSVLLDDVAGYGSSFLEEAFGGLVRVGFGTTDIEHHLRVVAHTNRFQHHARSAHRYISEAALTAAA